MFRPLVCAFVCLFLYSSAKADPFTLTSGSAATGFDLFSLSASGPNITIGGGAGVGPERPGGGSFAFATCSPFPCAPGSTMNVGGVFAASNLNIQNNFGGVATINGVTFFGVNFSGALNFTGSVVLPPDFVTGQEFLVPFSMQGQPIGTIRCPEDPLNCTRQVFDISLTGSGTARATIPQSGPPTVRYDFSSDPEPVPEPASLGLLGVGLVVLNRVYDLRKRRSRKQRY